MSSQIPVLAEDVLVAVARAEIGFVIIHSWNQCLPHDLLEDEHYKSGFVSLRYFRNAFPSLSWRTPLTLQLIFAHCVLSAVKLEETLGNHLRVRLVIGIMVRLKVGMLQCSFDTDALCRVEGE